MKNEGEREVTTILFTLGSLEVYGHQTLQEAHYDISPKELFWRDAGSPQGYGPFLTLHQTMEHYKHMVEQFKRQPVVPEPLEEPPAASVINVDFRNSRKRLHDV